MQFNRIIGKIDKKIIEIAEKKLTEIFLELGTRSDNDHCGTQLGGDPLIFSLLVPVEHVATLNIPTAATDGRRFYWNPQWLAGRNLFGVRLTCYHESGHALYMHPQRRGKRIARLWNIAVDYIVNGMVMEDLKIRLKSDAKVHEIFTHGLGNYLTLDQCVAMFINPFAPLKGLENYIPEIEDPHEIKVELPAPDEDRELTEEEKKELAKRGKKYKFYYADPNLSDEMKRPEKIYDLLYSHLPKCPECGSVGIYPLPKKPSAGSGSGGAGKSKEKGPNGKEKSDKQDKQLDTHNDDGCNHNNGNDSGSDDNKGSGKGDAPGSEGSEGGKQSGDCSTCGGGFDILDFGSTVDEHIDASEDPDKMAKRMSDAIKAARTMAGRIPQGLEDELGLLSAPRIRWQDFIRTKLVKARAGNSKNDWTKFRSRPLFAGLMIPKRVNCIARFGCLLDTSGSMTKEDMAFGISQLCSLDERSEGVVIPADAQIYWDQSSKLRAVNKEQLSHIKIVGRGGTKYAEFFADYQKHIGKQDFLIVITDGFLAAEDVKEMISPGIDVIWLITSGSAFNAPFGRVFDLMAT